MATDIGAATMSAKNELTIVPKMKSAAPNFGCTGSQADVPMNPRPNREIAGLA